MAINFVKGVAFYMNTMPLWDCPKTVQIPCGNIQIQGVEWWVPIVSGGKLCGYRRWLGNSPGGSDPPQPDAVKTLRIWDIDGNNTLWILIENSDDETSFVDNCNGCCGTTPVMASVTIPNPIVEDCACAVDGEYTYNFTIPSNPNALKYNILLPTVNGVVLTPALSAAGYATPAALLTAVQTNWAGAGTWSLQAGNTVLRLVSEDAACVGLSVVLLAASYCLTVGASGSPDDYNGIKFGTDIVSFPTISVDADNRDDLVNAIRPFLVGTISTSVAGKIQYTGLQKPVEMTFDGVLVTGRAWAAGVCA